jgi:uncharacterized LabA/DUF88 family protein
MRSHSALYVDAGYLIAASATRLTGSSLRRGVSVDYAQIVEALIELVEERTGLPLLRVYWYDAAKNGMPDGDQEQIALLPRVKLRLGRIGVEGEQKGVDLRIGLDMVGHSRNGAIDTIYLLSGDDDLTEAVEEAQNHGVQVVVLAVPASSGTPHGISRHLIRAADGLETLDGQVLDRTVSASKTPAASAPASPAAVAAASRPVSPADAAKRPAATAVHAATAAPAPAPVYSGATGTRPVIAAEYQRDAEELEATIRSVSRKAYDAWRATATSAQLAELLAGRPTIPRDLDRALLVDVSDALGEYSLGDRVRVQLRTGFWNVVGEDR